MSAYTDLAISLGFETYPNDRSDFTAMASELDNFRPSPADFPRDSFASHRSRLLAQRIERENTPFGPPQAPAPPYRDSVSSIYSAASFEPVALLSWEEIYNQEVSEDAEVPPLVINNDHFIGDRSVLPDRDGFFYYDPNVQALNELISERTITNATPSSDMGSEEFFRDHAVRVFTEVDPVPGITEQPLYKFVGKYFLRKTDQYLSSEQWRRLRKDVKTKVVKRFIKNFYSGIDSDALGHYSESDIRKFYEAGNMLPFVFLFTLREEATPFPSPMLQVETEEPAVEDLFPATGSDQESVYSQDSDPREDHQGQEIAMPIPLRSRFSVSTLASANPIVEPELRDEMQFLRSRFSSTTQGSPAEYRFRDTGAPRSEEPEHRAIYIPDIHWTEERAAVFAEEAYEDEYAYAYEADHEKSVGDEGADEGDRDDAVSLSSSSSGSYASFARQYEYDQQSQYQQEIQYSYTNDPAHPSHPINARTPLRRNAFLVAELMRAPYGEVQRFREHLRDTATEGSERRGILQILDGPHEHGGVVAPVVGSPLVGFSSDGFEGGEVYEGEHGYEAAGGFEGDDEPVTMKPWFAGFEP